MVNNPEIIHDIRFINELFYQRVIVSLIRVGVGGISCVGEYAVSERYIMRGRVYHV